MLAAPPGAGGPRSGAPASAADAVTRVSTGCPITWRAGWPRGRCAVGPRVRAAPRRTAGPRARTPPAGRSAASETRGTVPCGVVPARHPGRRRRSRPASGSGPGTHPCPAGRPAARRPRGRRPPHGAPDPRGGDARDAPRGGRAGGRGPRAGRRHAVGSPVVPATRLVARVLSRLSYHRYAGRAGAPAAARRRSGGGTGQVPTGRAPSTGSRRSFSSSADPGAAVYTRSVWFCSGSSSTWHCRVSTPSSGWRRRLGSTRGTSIS